VTARPSRLALLCVLAICAGPAHAQEKPRLQQLPPPPVPAPAPPEAQDAQPREGERRSDRWGAVAYTADGAFGAAYGIDAREDAERLAVDECRREATAKADCARGVVAKQDSWFHIQFCRRGNDWSTHVTTRPTVAETNLAAAQFAQTSRYGAEGCRMVPNGLFHSGGLHTKM
jgi:hypothetical protein